MATKRAVHEAQLPEDEKLRRRKRRAENAQRRNGGAPVKKRNEQGGAKVQVGPISAAVVWDNVSLDDWDDQELMRGQRRSPKTGKFGRRPQVIPARMVQELTRRRFSRAHMLMSESLEDSVLMLRSIVNDRSASEFARIKAAETIFDRILGKPRESVEIGLSANLEPSAFQRAFTAAIVGSMEQAEQAEQASEVIDATIVDAEIAEG